VTLATRYLGFDLPHPLMPGAGPWLRDPDQVRRLEDAGASAIVLPSLFEEELQGKADEYLEHIARARQAVSVPVIASLNGVTVGGWLEYARQIESAGAQALELNVYRLVTDPYETAEAVERKIRDMLIRLQGALGIPLAVKLSPFHTSLAHFAHRLDEAGVGGLVLFNRFYQPDLDPEAMTVVGQLRLSDSSELLLRVRWLAILTSTFGRSLACSGGVHTVDDALKAVLAGAHAIQMVSALLQHGAERLGEVLEGMSRWLERHGFDSLEQLRGRLALTSCPDPGAFERAQYLEILGRWEEE